MPDQIRSAISSSKISSASRWTSFTRQPVMNASAACLALDMSPRSSVASSRNLSWPQAKRTRSIVVKYLRAASPRANQ